MKALLDLLKTPAVRKALIVVVASALVAGAAALGLPSDAVKDLCTEILK
jgi:hypothetical protein